MQVGAQEWYFGVEEAEGGAEWVRCDGGAGGWVSLLAGSGGVGSFGRPGWLAAAGVSVEFLGGVFWVRRVGVTVAGLCPVGGVFGVGALWCGGGGGVGCGWSWCRVSSGVVAVEAACKDLIACAAQVQA